MVTAYFCTPHAYSCAFELNAGSLAPPKQLLNLTSPDMIPTFDLPHSDQAGRLRARGGASVF